MKTILLLLSLATTLGATAQKVLNNATLKITMETVIESSGDEGGGPFGRGPMETNYQITLKDSMQKIVTKSNFANSITINDNTTGITTNLNEGQGEKTGYTLTREDKLAQKQRQDSVRKAQEQNKDDNEGAGGQRVVRLNMAAANIKNIDYTTEAKVVNKIDCKKAIVTTANKDGVETKIIVWYSDAHKLPKGVWQQRMGLMLDTFNGLPVQFETVRTMAINGNEMTSTTTYNVTEIKTDATIDDKEFALPKGYKMKTYAEYIKDNPNGGGFGGRGVIRIGG